MSSSQPERMNTMWWDWYGNYTQRGKNSEIVASIEYLTKNGESIYNENVSLRIHGNATRSFPQKSFRLSDNKYYGKGKIKDPFDSGDSKRESYIVRNSGNDWGITMFADAFMQSISSDLNLVTQKSQPVHVLINGCYWGIYNIRDRFDKDFLQNIKDNGRVAIIESEKFLNEGKTKDLEDFKELQKVLKSDQDSEFKSNYLKKHCDVKSLNDYFIVQSFFGNSDWPGNNNKTFRIGKKDKWKWLIYDLDYGLGYDPDQLVFEKIRTHNGVLGSIFNVMMENQEMRKKFIARYQELLETKLNKDNLLQRYEAFVELYSSDIQFQINRWRKPSSVTEWKANCQSHIDFIKNRQKHILKELKLLDGISKKG